MRLIRSKGVGVYFVTQNPLDIPETVLGQLGNRVQHALRAYTPRDQKAVKSAAQTMRANPKLDSEKAITELSVGEALLSLLDEKGRPAIVERAYIQPPASRIGPLSDSERGTIIKSSLLYGHYEQASDRESAYEKLKNRTAAKPETPDAPVSRDSENASESDGNGVMGKVSEFLFGKVGPRGGKREGWSMPPPRALRVRSAPRLGEKLSAACWAPYSAGSAAVKRLEFCSLPAVYHHLTVAQEEFKMNESRQLARFVSELKYEHLPPEVIAKVKDLILDQGMLMMGISTLPWSKVVYEYVRDWGDDKQESTIAHYGYKTKAENAVFANSSFGDGIEIDDHYLPGQSHPGSS